MISVEEAKRYIKNNSVTLSPVKTSLSKAAGYTLAEDVFAIADIPAFRQSSMDGYAIRFSESKHSLVVKGEMAAGAEAEIKLGEEEAVRIFTGAPLPEGADTVVMQEKVTVENARLFVNDQNLLEGLNVRGKGAEIKTGELAIKKGNILTPAAVGFLAGIGITDVSVYPSPRVTIVVTGKELQRPGKPLAFGQVYEANSFSLIAALENAKIKEVEVLTADDQLEIVKSALDQALQNSDVVLVNGGISVGDYDFVLQASALCGVKQIFHKVKQKPGKPLFFGKKGDKLVFGLPGNPSSVLNCFYQYVLPALEIMAGRKNAVKIVTASLAKPYQKVAGITNFLKGYYDGETVLPLGAQESFRLSSFAQANCLICLLENGTEYEIGDQVDVHLLPQ